MGLLRPALFHYHLAAELGCATAQFNLAERHYHNREYQDAAHYYSLAAAQGHIQSELELGSLYELGTGVKQDIEEALHYYCEVWLLLRPGTFSGDLYRGQSLRVFLMHHSIRSLDAIDFIFFEIILKSFLFEKLRQKAVI